MPVENLRRLYMKGASPIKLGGALGAFPRTIKRQYARDANGEGSVPGVFGL